MYQLKTSILTLDYFRSIFVLILSAAQSLPPPTSASLIISRGSLKLIGWLVTSPISLSRSASGSRFPSRQTMCSSTRLRSGLRLRSLVGER
ncbi:hypothetical protein PGTUg99_024127 [Puccinia graminis f. sp. tritici]|uniref:Uncharacterized protein n=1 Tax=Puccinia graminis f. sp. tritici TaxID=56615 RepID=A0A5B0SEY2_PUCGR|nr:hypothetical protein PGTUg99_024127 [Puccinia graminis f. sp. tritici]